MLARKWVGPSVARVPNHPGMAGTVPELAPGVPRPGSGHFSPGILVLLAIYLGCVYLASRWPAADEINAPLFAILGGFVAYGVNSVSLDRH